MDREPDNISRLPSRRKRTRRVRPYPIHSLEDALAVARAVQDRNSGLPLDRHLLAHTLDTTTASSTYIQIVNSAAGYGLTLGGYRAPQISLTALGRRLVAPKDDAELPRALVEAALLPKVFAGFYSLLDGEQVPEDEYARNLLHRELAVRTELTEECLALIKANGLFAGILREVEDSLYVELPADAGTPAPGAVAPSYPAATRPGPDWAPGTDAHVRVGPVTTDRRILIGCAAASKTVHSVRTLLDEFGLLCSVVEGAHSQSHPVPPEVSQAMRGCHGAVLIFETPPQTSRGGAGDLGGMRYLLGAASFHYGDGVVLMVESKLAGFDLPTGLPRVVFDPSTDGEVPTRQLLQALHGAGVIKVTL